MTQMKHPQRERDIDILQIIGIGSMNLDLRTASPSDAVWAKESRSRRSDTGRSRSCGSFSIDLWRALRHHLAALAPGTRTHIDNPVGFPDGFLVMFDDNQAVAQTLKPPEGRQKTAIVPLVQDRWMARQAHREHPDSPEPIWLARRIRLALASRQSSGTPRQRQIIQSDI